jgi:hypothetical protein
MNNQEKTADYTSLLQEELRILFAKYPDLLYTRLFFCFKTKDAGHSQNAIIGHIPQEHASLDLLLGLRQDLQAEIARLEQALSEIILSEII